MNAQDEKYLQDHCHRCGGSTSQELCRECQIGEMMKCGEEHELGPGDDFIFRSRIVGGDSVVKAGIYHHSEVDEWGNVWVYFENVHGMVVARPKNEIQAKKV